VLAQGFILTLRQENKSERTIQSYMEAVRLFARYLTSHNLPVEPEQATTDAVRRFFVDMASQTAMRSRQLMSEATVANRFRSLRVFWNWCVADGEIARSPMDGMKPPKVSRTPPDVLSEEQLRALLKTCRGDDFYAKRDFAIVVILLDTGMRRTEIGELMMGDVLTREARNYELRVRGKGGDIRDCPLGFAASRALYRYMRARHHYLQNGRYQDAQTLWIGKNGPMTPRGVAYVVGRRAREANIPDVFTHKLRHTATHMLLSSGMGEGDVMKLLGWKNEKMVRYYGSSLAIERAKKSHKEHSPADRMNRD
jgi:site-specific recombinase XerD